MAAPVVAGAAGEAMMLAHSGSCPSGGQFARRQRCAVLGGWLLGSGEAPVRGARRARLWSFRILFAGVLGIALLTACTTGDPVETATGGALGSYVVPPGIHKIKHVIIIMQENRSFDSYFGTYPGAAGIPMHDGSPTVCVPDLAGGCDRPYHDTSDINGGGPHGLANSVADVNHGKMDGFIRQRYLAKASCREPNNPACRGKSGVPDVMGYHTEAEIPNYWAYARNFVLQDHMFEPVKSWSLPEHLYLVSGWSAKCRTRSPMSCVSSIGGPYAVKPYWRAVHRELTTGRTSINLAWTDITWLLHANHVSWAYYVQRGTEPDCADDSAETCEPVRQRAGTPGIWNPLPLFGDVQQNHQLRNIRSLGTYFHAAKAGNLPSVSWITPSDLNSENPPQSVQRGEA